MRRTPIIDGHKRFAVILVGGAQPPAIRRDAQTGSNVLALGAGPTPPGQAADRADIRIYSGITYGRTWFTSLDVLIPHGTPRPQDWQVLLQCVQHGADRSPPISLDLEPDGRLSLIARSDADTYRSLWSAPLAQGRWTRLVLGLRMGADGRARLWVDGRAVADIRQTLGWRQGRGGGGLHAQGRHLSRRVQPSFFAAAG